MNSLKSKYEHLLTAGVPILIAVFGGTLANIIGQNPEKDSRGLTLFMVYFVFQFIGLVLIFLSKLPNIKKGLYFYFGFKGMERRERFLYVAGYTLLIMTTAHEINFAMVGKNEQLRGATKKSIDGGTYLVVADDNGGSCNSILVDGNKWAYKINEAGSISPGLHTIECGGKIEFKIREGNVFYFNYWGP